MGWKFKNILKMGLSSTNDRVVNVDEVNPRKKANKK